jgi:DNA-binding NtrC family response regulator
MSRILIVDDKRSILDSLSLLLRKKGFATSTAATLDAALDLLGREAFDVVITDLRLGDCSGEQLIEFLHACEHPAACIVMTGYGSIESAVACMRLGAHDYLTKPVSPSELLLRIERLLAQKQLSDEVQRLRAEVQVKGALEDIVAESRAMRDVVERVRRISRHDLPVLITGETGTGKEVIAQAIHNSSGRLDRPFVAINCCALPEDLLDSELFGHVKGAFTGATRDAKGLFQQAHGGTLFLDEIGDISLRLQAKLLRVLQEGEIRRVGGSQAESVDVRIVAATNRPLEQMIRSGEFRSDLFFRLNVVPIQIPPLRERREDIAPLVNRFVDRLAQRLGDPMPRLGPDAWQRLLGYPYPGNIRQLENVIERTFALARGAIIGADEVQFDFDAEPEAFTGLEPGAPDAAADDEPANLDELVINHIRKVLDQHQGNQVLAAKALGISRSTLRRRLGLS